MLRFSINPFTPESDQCQNSPAASQEIWHHTVWRTWLFIAYSDEKWLYYKFSLHHSYNRFLKGWENTLFELRSERVKRIWTGFPNLSCSCVLKASQAQVTKETLLLMTCVCSTVKVRTWRCQSGLPNTARGRREPGGALRSELSSQSTNQPTNQLTNQSINQSIIYLSTNRQRAEELLQNTIVLEVTTATTKKMPVSDLRHVAAP